MKNSLNIKLILRSIIVLLLYYLFSYIFLLFFNIIKLDITKLESLYKTLLLSFMDILLVIILWFIYKKDLKEEFNIFKSNWKEFIFKNLKYWIIGLIIMSISNVIIGVITSNDMANNEEFVRGMIYKFPIYGVFSACIIAPFVEEIVFRKTFYDIIKDKYILMLTCGISFGLIHVVSTYEKISDLLYVIPYGVFGFIFSYMYYKTKTIFTSMIIHFMHNTILLSIYFATSSLIR